MVDSHPEVLLVTSRISRKWLLPKGWLINSLGPAGTAEREAYEEAGILGEVSAQPIGSFRYFKVSGRNEKRPAQAMVFGLRVTEMLNQWPEAHQRHRAWFSPSDAAEAVSEPTLAAFLRTLPEAVFCDTSRTMPAHVAQWAAAE